MELEPLQTTYASPLTPLKKHTPARLAIYVLLPVFILGLAAYAEWRYRFTHRPQPPSEHRLLFSGITYVRDVRRSPRPIIINVVTVDLTTPGIRFLVTPGTPNAQYPLKAQTTSEFLQRSHAQVAVNGDYFYPYYSDTILHYYPHSGDPVAVQGFAASDGQVYSKGPARDFYPTLFLSAHNRPSFFRPVGPVYNALSGIEMILEDGRYVPDYSSALSDAEPCNAIALDHTGKKLIVVVVDGRQPNYSEGVTERELVAIVRSYGGWNALELDGGGSESLVMQGKDGQSIALNAPIDCGIPGRERYVGNHLGIFALPAQGSKIH